MSRHIDADELIEFFDGYPDHIEFDVEDIKSIINEQDTADVRENVKGYWKKRKDKPLQNWYQCSNCGAICGETPKYCSECGADMRGEKNEIKK